MRKSSLGDKQVSLTLKIIVCSKVNGLMIRSKVLVDILPKMVTRSSEIGMKEE